MHASNKLPVYPDLGRQGRSGDRRLRWDRRGHWLAAGLNGAKVAVNGRDQAKIQAIAGTRAHRRRPGHRDGW